MKSEKLFRTVKKQIDAFDAYGLLEDGAPKDEFDNESAMIAGRLREGMTPFSIAKVIAQVMNEQFENIFSAEEFISHAEEIEKVLNKIDKNNG